MILSRNILKGVGESRHPCRTPTVVWNQSPMLSLKRKSDIMNRWTEYCSELYNHKASGDPSVLNCTQTDTEDDHPILCREVEAAIQPLRKREVSWSQQHPSRTGPSRWRGCNHCSHYNLQQDLADRRMANPKDPVLSHQTYQEDNLRQCQNYRTISLISPCRRSY